MFYHSPTPRSSCRRPQFLGLWFFMFFLMGCVAAFVVGTLAPKWGPRRAKWGPRRPETTPRPSQDPQNRGQDLPQDLEIPRSNIEAENSCFFVQKSMIPAMIFHALLTLLSHHLCALLTQVDFQKMHKNTVFFL